MAVYVLTVAAVSGWLGAQPPRSGLISYLIAVAPALPIGAALWLMGRYLVEESDEVVRTIHTQAVVAAVGIGLFVCTAWGFLAEYAGVWPLPLMLVFPLFCAAFGVAAPLVWAKYR